MRLSSRHALFSWSRADRAPDVSFFRLRALHWRPVLRPRQPVEPASASRFAAKLPKCLQQRVKWTPWLLER
jgi:hypothetical protein